MTNEQLLFQAANAADAALKLTKGAWNAGGLARPDAEKLEHAACLLHYAATELVGRARAKSQPGQCRD